MTSTTITKSDTKTPAWQTTLEKHYPRMVPYVKHFLETEKPVEDVLDCKVVGKTVVLDTTGKAKPKPIEPSNKIRTCVAIRFFVESTVITYPPLEEQMYDLPSNAAVGILTKKYFLRFMQGDLWGETFTATKISWDKDYAFVTSVTPESWENKYKEKFRELTLETSKKSWWF